MAETIPDDRERSRALAGIAERLAGADPRDPALIERALAVAEAIPDDWERSGRWPASPSGWPASIPADPALIERALAVAETIPDDRERSEALAAIAERLAGIDPARTRR